MIELAILVALATLTVGLVVAFALRQLPTVRLQLAGLALLAVVLPLRSSSCPAGSCSTWATT